MDSSHTSVRWLLASVLLGALSVAALVLGIVGRYGPTPEHSEFLLLQMGGGVGALLGLVIGSLTILARSLGCKRFPRTRVDPVCLGGAWGAGIGATWHFASYFAMAYRDGGGLGDHGGFTGLEDGLRLGLPVGGLEGATLGVLVGLAAARYWVRPPDPRQEELA